MNFLESFKETPKFRAKATGKWFVIRVIPDVFTGELLNVGVCVVQPNGSRLVKVIEKPNRLTCFYGDSSSVVLMMAAVAAEAAKNGRPPPSKQIIFESAISFYNQSPDAALESMFRSQVTAARPMREDDKEVTISDEEVTKKIIDALKLNNPNNADSYIPQSSQIIIDTDRGKQVLSMPLQPFDGVGDIRSASYQASTLKLHMMESLLNIGCAAEHRKAKKRGLFLLRSKRKTSEAERELDNAIDSIASRITRDVRFEVETSPRALAQAIDEWALR